jgi:hypothetical protein
MLPKLLAAEQRTAVAAFIDFRKAYDTVSREFLYAAAEILGVGAGFVKWMKVLLTDTRSCAVVNGFRSRFYVCDAGVRQGCPLAPLMYLFAGQALLCHLKQLGIGIDLAAVRFTAAQYADDVEPVLPDESSVPAFVAGMDVYGDATGQRMQPSKSKLLPLGGATTTDAGESVAGIQVVDSAKALGIIFGTRDCLGMDWDHRMGIVRARMQKISRIPNLSAFGRAFAISGYALSTLLYHAQYTGLLPSEHAENLIKWSTAVIDKQKGPNDDMRGPPGIPSSCLDAHPRDGGFGLLPVRAHLFSRWAVDAVQLLFGSDQRPWVAAGRVLLAHHVPVVPGGEVWGLVLCDKQRLFMDIGGRVLPQPLRSLAVGLRALPPLRFVGDVPDTPGDWCYHVPLWSNPTVAQLQQWDWFGQQRQVLVGLEYALPGLFGLPQLRCVGEAVYWLKIVADLCAAAGDPGAQFEGYRMHVLEPLLQTRLRYQHMQVALTDLQALVAAIPVGWQEAARAVLRAQPPLRLPIVTDALIASARARVCADLGWRTQAGEAVRPAALTVALATRLQVLDSHLAIADRHRAFVHELCQLDLLQPGGGPLPGVPKVLARWWKLRVPNFYKEAAWRLTLDAFPTAARMHSGVCCVACGVPSPGFAHHFWSCPVADAVRAEVEAQLRIKGWLLADTRLRCDALWLGVKPHHALHRMVWDMVCLAAIHAMSVGRKAAWSVSHRLETPDLVAAVAQKVARAGFWSVLADFAASAVVPRRARSSLLTSQPFLAWSTVLLRGNGLRVVRLTAAGA